MKRHHFINILLIIVIVSFIFIVSLFSFKKKTPLKITEVTNGVSYENLLTTYDPDNAVSVLYTNDDADIDKTILIAPGTIVMWYNGTLIPDGWTLCDGYQGTPDLRNRFIKGGNLSNSSNTPKTKDRGGNNKIYLNINNIPDHLHSATAKVSYSGSHFHNGKTEPHVHTHNYELPNEIKYMDEGDYDQVWNDVNISSYNKDTTEVDDHIHNFGNTTEKNAHIHQVNIKVDSVGYSVPIENDPLHYKLNFIMKLEGQPDDHISLDEKNVLHADREGNIMSTVLIPRGIIVMWNGYNIPYGWALCDGTNDTPNLIDMFVKSTINEDYGPGGSRYVTIQESNLPPHTHDAVCYLEENGSHSHVVQDSPAGKHSHRYSYKYSSPKTGDERDWAASSTDILRYNKTSETSEDSHTHNFITSNNGEHSHIITEYNMENIVGGRKINMDPPYYVLCYIMKI